MVEIDDPLKDLAVNNDITFVKVLNNLLNSKDIELKSHIAKPKKLASLLVLSIYLKEFGYTKSAKTILTFINTFLKYMVSYERLSRTEIIKALIPQTTKETEGKLLTSLD